MNIKITNQLILPCYEKKLREVLNYIIQTKVYDFENIEWVLYATNRSLNNTAINTEIFGEITGKDIAYCDIRSNIIYITNYTLKQNDSFIIKVILHEIAHIKSFNRNHDRKFIECFVNLVEYYNQRTKGEPVLNGSLLYKKKGMF